MFSSRLDEFGVVPDIKVEKIMAKHYSTIQGKDADIGCWRRDRRGEIKCILQVETTKTLTRIELTDEQCLRIRNGIDLHLRQKNS